MMVVMMLLMMMRMMMSMVKMMTSTAASRMGKMMMKIIKIVTRIMLQVKQVANEGRRRNGAGGSEKSKIPSSRCQAVMTSAWLKNLTRRGTPHVLKNPPKASPVVRAACGLRNKVT